MFGQDRAQLRRVYFEAWRKYRAGEPAEPLEQVIAHVIAAHPEYRTTVEDPDATAEREYLPDLGESNPFLHMGMHIAVHEQLTTDRPAGIRDLYQILLRRHQEPHAVEHRMMECLAEVLWQAQRAGRAPDEQAYLDCLKRLTGG